jgi:hypothetical protein
MSYLCVYDEPDPIDLQTVVDTQVCDGTAVYCDGNSYEGKICTDNGNGYWKVEGLSNTGIVEFIDPNGDLDLDGFINNEDVCLYTYGQYEGCPYRDDVKVTMHVLDLFQKSSDCQSGDYICEVPVTADVRVFDREDDQFKQNYGILPFTNNYDSIYENNIASIGEYSTDPGTGECQVPKETIGEYLVVAKYFTDSSTSQYIYPGVHEQVWDFDGSGVASLDLHILKVVQSDGSAVYYTSGQEQYSTSMQVYFHNNQLKGENNKGYPLMFLSDKDQVFDLSKHIPKGYTLNKKRNYNDCVSDNRYYIKRNTLKVFMLEKNNFTSLYNINNIIR